MVPLAHEVAAPLAARWRLHGRTRNALDAAGPPLLFGLRLWAAVCLALYVTFWLHLDNGFWGGTSAALVCQPRLGASLRKGWYRMIGTIVGAVAIVVLTVPVYNRLGSEFMPPLDEGTLSSGRSAKAPTS